MPNYIPFQQTSERLESSFVQATVWLPGFEKNDSGGGGGGGGGDGDDGDGDGGGGGGTLTHH